MRRIVLVLFGSVFFLTTTTHSSLAGGSPRAHDGGFFLRLSAGGGSASTSIEEAGNDIEFSGLSGDINFAVGAIVSNNLALHGTIWGWALDEPDAELNGVEGDLDGSITMSAFGGGVTYYLMPANVYLSGSVGIATVEVDSDFIDEESDTGFALDATVGKEWWVGNSWGLGVAGAVGYHSVPVDGFDNNFGGVTFGLRFSATLN